MTKALSVLNQMVDEGVLIKYVIGGSVAALFYTEPFFTDDCDVFIFFPENTGLSPLSDIYTYLIKKGYFIEGPFVVIEAIKVQFLPITTPLVQEAFNNSITVDVFGVQTSIFTLEYLMAICVETGRPRDRYKIGLFVEQTSFDKNKLEQILITHNLLSRWQSWTKEA